MAARSRVRGPERFSVTWSPKNQSFICNSGPKRAPVRGGEERTEGGRKSDKAQLTDYPENRCTKFSGDVRGKAKGKKRSSALCICGRGSVELMSNHFSDVQSKMAWFARFSESAQCLFRKWMRIRTSTFTFTGVYTAHIGWKLDAGCPSSRNCDDFGQKRQSHHGSFADFFSLSKRDHVTSATPRVPQSQQQQQQLQESANGRDALVRQLN